jgi:hypothetical protein
LGEASDFSKYVLKADIAFSNTKSTLNISDISDYNYLNNVGSMTIEIPYTFVVGHDISINNIRDV